MPITKSAKKAMRQAKARTERRKPFKTLLKSTIKKVQVLAKTDKDSAVKELPKAFSVIDKATKKNILHKNTAARKKSSLSKLVA